MGLNFCCGNYSRTETIWGNLEIDLGFNQEFDSGNKGQNEFMKSLFLPKYEQKIVRIFALCSEGRNLVCILEETMTS